MSVLTSPKTYVGLAIFHAADAVLCAIPNDGLGDLLDGLEFPRQAGPVKMGWVLATVKSCAAVGLLSVFRFPGLARLTTAMLTLYFTIAVSLHVRVFKRAPAATRFAQLMATAFLVACAAMTIEGPRRRAR